jgi:hypothetical protein
MHYFLKDFSSFFFFFETNERNFIAKVFYKISICALAIMPQQLKCGHLRFRQKKFLFLNSFGFEFFSYIL